MAAYVHQSSQRILGDRAQYLLTLIGSTVNGVIYGLICTALAQGLLAVGYSLFLEWSTNEEDETGAPS